MKVTVDLGELWNGSPEMIDQAVLTEVAVQMRGEVFQDDNLQSKVAFLVNSMLQEQVVAGVRQAVASTVELALDEVFEPVDKYGERRPGTTIRAEIKREVQMAAATLSGSRRDDWSRDKSRQFWEGLVGKHTKALVKEEVGAFLEELRTGSREVMVSALLAHLDVDGGTPEKKF